MDVTLTGTVTACQLAVAENLRVACILIGGPNERSRLEPRFCMSNQSEVLRVEEENLPSGYVTVKGHRSALEQEVLETGVCDFGVRVPQVRLQQSLIRFVQSLCTDDYGRLVIAN